MKFEYGRVGRAFAVVAIAVAAVAAVRPAAAAQEPSEAALRTCMEDTIAKVGENAARKNCRCQFALLKQRLSADDYDLLMQLLDATAPDVPQQQQELRMRAIFAEHGVDKDVWAGRVGPQTVDLEQTCSK